MTKKFNLRDYIDDIAEVSSTSSCCPSEEEDYSIANISNGEEEKDETNNSIPTEPLLNIKSNHQNNRKHFMKKCIKEDEKEIKAILERNFKRTKCNASDSESNILIRKKVTENKIKAPILLPTDQQRKPFHIGFKKKQSSMQTGLPSTMPTKTNHADSNISIENTNDNESDNESDIMKSLKYSHEKRMKKKLSENSTAFNQSLIERIKEDEIILKNVVKKNTLLQSINSNSRSLFYQKLNINKSLSFLHSIKETKPSSEGNNKIKLFNTYLQQ